MAIIKKHLANTALSATTLAFTFGYLGCAHAKTTQTSDAAQTSNQTSGSNQMSNAGSGNNGTNEAYGSNTPEDQQTREMMKFSRNGHTAIDDIQLARIAIFEGHPKTSIQLMDHAQTAIAAAQKEAPDFKLPQNTKNTHTAGGSKVNGNAMNQGATMVPVDGHMTLGEDYVATPEKQSHLDKANQHLKNGETKQAIDELKLAGVDVNFTLVLMPIETSKHELQQAVTDANAGKYYEANLDLKKIEDSLVITEESLVGAPQNGSNHGSSHSSGTGQSHHSTSHAGAHTSGM